MRRILMAGALALAAGGSAFAADLPQPAAPLPRAPATYVPTIAPPYQWGGVYLGINGGYGFGNSDWTAATGTTGNFNTSGFLVGGTLGGNFQMGAIVFGVEGDFDWTNLSGSATCGPTLSCTTQSEWLGTARGRLGYAFDRVLLYGTGGGAFGNVQTGFVGGTFSGTTQFGWTGGGGIEVAFAPNWTGKVEYLYVDLANSSGAFPGSSVSFTESVVRGGINYKFNF